MPLLLFHYLSLPLPSGVCCPRTSPARSEDSRRPKEGKEGAGAESKRKERTNLHTKRNKSNLEEPQPGVESGSPASFIYKVGVQLSHQGRVLEVLTGSKESCRSCGEPGGWTSTVWSFWFCRLMIFGEVQVESWLISDAALFQSGLWASLCRDTEGKEV